jgi:hypothetical protein
VRRDRPKRAVWLAVLVVVALGAAGLAAVLAYRAATDSGEERTRRADEAIRPVLHAAVEQLEAISTDFQELGRQGRIALGALTRGDAAALDEAIGAGQVLVDRIASTVALARSRLATVPGIGRVGAGDLGPATIELWNDVHAALGTTDGLGAAWAAVRAGGADGQRLIALLGRHDEFVGSAARAGSEGDYAEAVRLLDLAAPVMADLRALEASLAKRVDASLLRELLDRTTRLDDALRRLYALLVLTDGEQTAQVEAALAEVDAARRGLPEDTRALALILSEIGLAGPQQAVVAIEEARARLFHALETLGDPEPSGGAQGSDGTKPAPGDSGSDPVPLPS